MKKLTVLLMGILLMMFCVCGCGGADNNENGNSDNVDTQWESSLRLSLDEWPVIDGATALAPYYEAMAAKLLDMPIEEARQHVMCSTTDGAYENLINKTADMIFCALPSEEQVKMAKASGVEFECTPFLNGGFVFFVNKDNPVDSLTKEQLYDIYSGKITNWKDVGGNDEEIIAYQRSEGSGSQTGIYRYIIPKEEIMQAPQEKKIGDMAGIIDAVAGYENGAGSIGYSYYYYVANMHYSDTIKLIGVEGVVPSDETIADGSYPLINQSQVIIRADEPEDSILRTIIEWIISEEGQRLGEENGYVRNASLQ